MKHLAIIVDGNGRWGVENGMNRQCGHMAGAENMVRLVKFLIDYQNRPQYITFYLLSQENMGRNADELDNLMHLFREYLPIILEIFIDNNIRLNIIGNYQELSQELKDGLDDAVNQTKHNNEMVVTIAVNYSSHAEIVQCFNNILDKKLTNIVYDDIYRNLMTHNLPPVDMLIRPGREKRLSNFLLLQCAYAELFFSDILFPDFNGEELEKLIKEYNSRNRRYGKV